MRTAILIAGLLAGSACSEHIAAVADAASDAFSQPDVSIDTSTAEALAALGATVQAHEERLTALEQAIEAADAERLSMRGRIYTLEGAKLTTKSDIADLKKEDVALKDSLDALSANDLDLQAQIDVLAAQPSDKDCPEDMMAAADLCVESQPREPWLLGGAHANCTATGRRLCTLAEIQAGCEAGLEAADVGIWTSTPAGDGFAISTHDAPGCNPVHFSVGYNDGTLRPYRCCVTR